MGGAGAVPASTRFTPIDPIRVLRQYQPVLLLTVAVGLVLGIILWAILLFTAPRFESRTQLRITGGVESGLDTPGAQPRTGGNMDTIEARKATEMAQLMSNFVIDSAINELRDTKWFQQYVRGEGLVELTKAREDLQDALRVFSVRNSFHFQANLRIRYREEAQRVLDTVVARYLSQIDSEAVNQAAQVRAGWVRQRDNLNRQLESIQQELRLFTQTEDIESLDARANSESMQHQLLATRVMEMRFELARIREGYAAMQQAQRRGEVLHDPVAVAEVRLDPSVNQREERMRLLREQRGVYLNMFGPSHRQVRQIDRRLIEVEQDMQAAMDNLLRQRQEVQLEQYAKAIASFEEQVMGLERELDRTRAAVMDLAGKQERYQQLKNREAQLIDDVRSRETALANQQAIAERPDKTPVERMFLATEPRMVFPKWYIVPTMTMIVAVGLVLGLILLIEMSDQRLKGPSDVSTLPGAKPLGMIPDTAEDPSSPERVEGVVRGDPTGLMAESFRQVRTALVRSIEKIDARTVMFTCGQAQAGVTSVLGNLADGLSLIGRRVLVIDANFRRPGQHRQYALPIAPGLAEVLAGECSIDAAIKSTGEQSVSVLTAGNCAGAEPELLERPGFGQLLASLRQRYDVILIDTPPVFVGSEAKLVARQADSVVIVARAMSDERGMIARAIRELDDHRAQLLGIVLNRARASAGGYFRKNFEAFYRYRQQEPTRPAKAPAPVSTRT
jgi:polysaccharide biosynthesis transport protein